MRNMKTTTSRWFALLLVLVYLVSLTACNNQQPVATEPSESVSPVETEPHSHEFTDGLCQCGESNGFDAFTVFTADGLTAVERQDEEEQFSLTSSNAAGETGAIRLDTQFDAVYGHYYEAVYKFTSNVAGSVRFASPDAVFYDTDTYEIVSGENEIAVRFAAGQAGKIAASLELGGLESFELTFTEASVTELKADFSKYFLDVAPENASGNMNLTADGALAATFKTNEGWRIKLAVDRSLVKGKTYETTFVFTKENGKSQNVTYTVYDNAATIIGSRTKWVDNDLCVATFYLTANETITKGTCLELGMISGGEEANMTFTYIDFEEVDEAKLEKLLAENPFPGVNVWTEGALTPAVGTQTAEGLRLTNTNPATDWWKVKLEQDLQCQKGKYYRMTFGFTSNAAGRIKFVNDDATYHGSNEFDVKKGENTFTVELKSGGNSYSCLELGGLGPCELLFTEIKVESIDEPSKAPTNPGTSATRFSSFKVWTEASVQAIVRQDTATTMTLTSQNDPTDWWKIKVEKDLSGTAGKCYELTYTFTSNAAGRIKFVNDDAFYYGGNEYDVVAGENTFTVQFKYGGKPYSCLELGGLSPFQLVFTNYSIKEIEEPVYESNGFEHYQAWTEASMKFLTREDTATSMILISENEPGDWWKVKVENNFPTEAGKTYEAVYTFTSDAEGDIKFGGDNMTCHTPDVYHVVAGENTFSVTFTVSASNAYNCLELGGLGNFRLEFTSITLKEVSSEPEHTHSFVNGKCECGETNGFAGFGVWNEGSLTPVVREDTENSMIITSANAPGDWWKVKVEWPLSVEEGKTYEVTFIFNSTAAGRIKYHVGGASFLTGQEYDVVVGENTFTVRFTAGSDNYSCLELGGLGNFTLTFTGVSFKEV